MGMLVGSPLSQALGNMLMGLNRPAIPCRLFTSELEALKWLRGFEVEAERPAPSTDHISPP